MKEIERNENISKKEKEQPAGGGDGRNKQTVVSGKNEAVEDKRFAFDLDQLIQGK